MAGRLRTYGFINARLRTRISMLLDETRLDDLIRAASLPEAVQMLRNTPFAVVADAYRDTGDIRSAELALFARDVELYQELRGLTRDPVRAFVEALLRQFEIDVVQHALRLWFDARVRRRTVSAAAGYLYRPRIIEPLDLDGIINAENLEGVAGVLGSTPYAAIVRDHAEDVDREESLFALETALDRYFYDQLLAAAENLPPRDGDIVRRVIGVQVDLHNLNSLCRSKVLYELPPERAQALLIPYGRYLRREELDGAYEDTSPFDIAARLVQKHYPGLGAMLTSGPAGTIERLALIEDILRAIRRHEAHRLLCGYPFTVGVILSYFVLKREESRQLMMLLNAKSYGWEPEQIRAVL